jgi:uncharacterized protein (UPF0261 family)
MPGKQIALISTLDTKAAETAYLARLISLRGYSPVIIDTGSRIRTAIPEIPAVDYPNRVVAAAAGEDLERLKDSTIKRDDLMMIMARGATAIIHDRYVAGQLDGIIGIGGNQGSSIAAMAMRTLPIGFPKMLVSTVASGNIRPYIGYSDIAVVFSVSDLVGGPNPVSRSILSNALAAVIGMIETGEKVCTLAAEKTIALTALGNTEDSASRIFTALRRQGYEVITFHASGAGGSAMEDLIEQGMFGGVIDLTPHEIAEEIAAVGSYVPIRPGRLTAAGKKGIPQVVSLGGMEYYCGGPKDSLPLDHQKNRIIYMHNPLNANVKLTHEELEKAALLMASRLNESRGKLRVLIPLRGWSVYGKPDGPFYDPPGTELFLKMLYKNLNTKICSIQEIDAHINDAAFSDACVKAFLEIIQTQGEVKS